MRRLIMAKIALTAFLILMVLGCGIKKQDLHGAGATFPEPLYRKMFSEYLKETYQKINYTAIGSGGGIFRLKEKSVDFGASDMIAEDEEWNKQIFYIPICIGAVTIAYNLPAAPQLDLTPELLTDIFMGEIKYWHDERIKALNPNIILPNQRILLIDRSDNSGTCRVFDNYLSKVSAKWQKRDKNILKQIFSLSTASNREMSQLILDTPGSIGLVCLSYAVMNKMSFAAVQNAAGNFILPSPQNVSLAAETDVPLDISIDLTATNSEFGYPISSLTWLMVYRDISYMDKAKAEKLIALLDWMLTAGQAYCAPLNYAPLPAAVASKAQDRLKNIQY